eukprot:s6199_g3.t3
MLASAESHEVAARSVELRVVSQCPCSFCREWLSQDAARSGRQEMVFMRTKCNRMDLIKNLNLWGNDLQDISVIQSMPNLEVLSLSVNQVNTLVDLQHCPKLSELYLRKNEIMDLSEILYLRHLRRMKVLWLADNPCADLPYYRQYILHHLPNLTKIDSEDVTEDERRDAQMIDFGGVETNPVDRAHAGGDFPYQEEAEALQDPGFRQNRSESEDSYDDAPPPRPQEALRRFEEESPSRRPPLAMEPRRSVVHERALPPRESAISTPVLDDSEHNGMIPAAGQRRFSKDLIEQRRLPPQRKNSPHDPGSAARIGLPESPVRGAGQERAGFQARRDSEIGSPFADPGRGARPPIEGQGRPANAWADAPPATLPHREEGARHANGASRTDNILCAVLALVKDDLQHWACRAGQTGTGARATLSGAAHGRLLRSCNDRASTRCRRCGQLC